MTHRRTAYRLGFDYHGPKPTSSQGALQSAGDRRDEAAAHPDLQLRPGSPEALTSPGRAQAEFETAARHTWTTVKTKSVPDRLGPSSPTAASSIKGFRTNSHRKSNRRVVLSTPGRLAAACDDEIIFWPTGENPFLTRFNLHRGL